MYEQPMLILPFRVRYCETDQMGTVSSARALEWFEHGRTELLRSMGTPYAEMEAKGVFCPVAEAYVKYAGRARYDDPLNMTISACMAGKARVRFNVSVVHAESGAKVVEGYTIHAFTDASGKAVRPPAWFVSALENPPE